MSVVTANILIGNFFNDDAILSVYVCAPYIGFLPLLCYCDLIGLLRKSKAPASVLPCTEPAEYDRHGDGSIKKGSKQSPC